MAEQRLGSARDIPGRQREYETIYIMKPDLAPEVIGGLNTRVRQIVETGGGRLLRFDNWGRRKLAYTVRKESRGVYLFMSYLGSAGLVEEVERNLRLSESVIRYYSVKIAENVTSADRASEVTDESFAKAATPSVEAEEIATGQASDRPVDDEDGGFDYEEAVFSGYDDKKGK